MKDSSNDETKNEGTGTLKFELPIYSNINPSDRNNECILLQFVTEKNQKAVKIRPEEKWKVEKKEVEIYDDEEIDIMHKLGKDIADIQKTSTKREHNYEQYSKLKAWEKRALRNENELRWYCSQTHKRTRYEGKEFEPTSDFMILRVVERNGKKVLVRQKVTKWVKMEKAYIEDWAPEEADRIQRNKIEEEKRKTHLAEMRAKIFGKKGKAKAKMDDSEDENENSDNDSDYGAPKGLKLKVGKANVKLNGRKGGYVDVSQSDIFAASNIRHLGRGAGDEGIDIEYNEQFDDDDVDMEHVEEAVFDGDEENEEVSEDEDRGQQDNQHFMKGTKRNFDEVGNMEMDMEEDDEIDNGKNTTKKTKYEIEQSRFTEIELIFLNLIRRHGGTLTRDNFNTERKVNKEFKRITKERRQELKDAIDRFSYENKDTVIVLRREYQ